MAGSWVRHFSFVATLVRADLSLCQKPFEPLPNPCESPKRTLDPLALCDRGVILSEMVGAVRLNFLPEMEIRTNFRKGSFG